MVAYTMAPRLRKAQTVKPLYDLNCFPHGFAEEVAKQIFAIRATSIFSDKEVDVTGNLWEQIFANGIGAKRETAISLGIDDIQSPSTSSAWSAKTVKWTNKNSIVEKIRDGTAKIQLISGRNSPTYSFDVTPNPNSSDPSEVGDMIIEIWNHRVKEVRAKFTHLRTVTMVKCNNLNKIVIFEKETELYRSADFNWDWNRNNNLVGSSNGEKKFTWQPHGSQFTINNVRIPTNAAIISISKPKQVSREDLLRAADWNEESFSVQNAVKN